MNKLKQLARYYKAHNRKKKGSIVIETQHQDDIKVAKQLEDMLNWERDSRDLDDQLH